MEVTRTFKQTCGKTHDVAMMSSNLDPSQPNPSAQGSVGFCSKRSDSQLRFHPHKAPAERLRDLDSELWRGESIFDKIFKDNLKAI